MKRSNSGFSIIEVLVAMFVFATGILGVAALQMKSMSLLSNSSSISNAMFAVNDIADRMRANEIGVAANAYDNLDEGAVDPGCELACTAAQAALRDVADVSLYLARELPDATLDITRLDDDLHTIAVTWTERTDGRNTTKNHSVTLKATSTI